MEPLSYEKRCESWAGLLQRRKHWEGTSLTHKRISKAGVKDSARFFSVVPSDRMSSSGDKLKHKKFHLSMRETFFALRVAKHWISCPGRLYSLPLQRHSNPTWMCSCITCSRCLGRELDWVFSRGPFQPQHYYDSVK